MFTPDKLCRLLADETRNRIALLLISETQLCVCELTFALKVSQPKISRHLALLRESGLLADERRGQWVYYRLHPELASWITQLLKAMLVANDTWVAENLAALATMNDRPQRCG